MEGYDDRSYGEAFADVYDDWYGDLSDVSETVATLLDLAAGGSILELGVGTGRIAVPLATSASGQRIVGVDSSPAMLAQLVDRDTARLVEPVEGSMLHDLPDGPFDVAFVADNTLFNLTGDGEQADCFRSVADRLSPGGRFVVEAFVPDDTDGLGNRRDDVTVRTLAADRVVLSVSVQRPDRQTAEGQFVEFTEVGGVRLRPWSIRYSSPAQLDAMAATAGFALEARWSSFGREPFDETSERHVSVYLAT